MGPSRIDFPEEDHALVTAKDTSPASAEVPADVGLIERRPKAIVDLVVEWTIQFASFCRHQGAPDPEVHGPGNLELPDRIDQADVRITIEPSSCVDRTVKAFGVERELDVLMDPSVDIDTSVDRKSTRLNSSHIQKSRMPSSA